MCGNTTVETNERIAKLESTIRAQHRFAAVCCAVATGALLLGVCAPPAADTPEIAKEIRARRLVIVDDRDVPRVVIGQDPVDTQRRSRGAGITVHDARGDERGGFGTMDDGSVNLAMDAPRGVGAPMRDRLGMGVEPDGASHFMLIDNRTCGVVRLHSDGAGVGGLQVFKWEPEQHRVSTKLFTFDGEKLSTDPCCE